MGLKHRLFRTVCVLLLCFGLLQPLPASAADLYFTSINDNLLPLTSDTMPVWSGGSLYVPYSVFDSNNTGVKLGFECSYERASNTVTLYNLQKMLVFDLRLGISRNELTGESYSGRAIIRNGRPYLPLYLVCDFFSLTYSYNVISQGFLVRIKNSAVVLSDAKFIDAAGDLINRRLREYNQSLNPAPEPSGDSSTVVPPAPDPDEDASPATVRTYLAFLCEDNVGIPEILDALGQQRSALFLCSPKMIQSHPDLIRRIWGSGHSIGILAEGKDTAHSRALLEQGRALLEQIIHSYTTIACVPDSQRAALKAEGWICWQDTLLLTPSPSIGANTFASNTLRRLQGRTSRTYLSLPGDESAARVLPALLRRLEDQDFLISRPLETVL